MDPTNTEHWYYSFLTTICSKELHCMLHERTILNTIFWKHFVVKACYQKPAANLGIYWYKNLAFKIFQIIQICSSWLVDRLFFNFFVPFHRDKKKFITFDDPNTHPQHHEIIECISITWVRALLTSSISMTFHGFSHDLFKFSKTLGLIVTSKKLQNFPCFRDLKQFNSGDHQNACRLRWLITPLYLRLSLLWHQKTINYKTKL